jgi:hypothetical protein
MKGKPMKIITIILFTLTIATFAYCSEEPEYYWIDANRRLLAFVGNPYARVVKPVIFVTSERQKIQLFHTDSGPGIYAFFLKGLKVYKDYGVKGTVSDDGFFLAKSKWIRREQYEEKKSLKLETKVKKPRPVVKKKKKDEGWFWEKWK